MDLCAITVIPCHFENPSKLCKTTIARLEAAIAESRKIGRPWQYLFVVTGDVPYEPGGETLAELMRDYLRMRNVQDEIMIAGDETGTFAEPRLVTELLRRVQKTNPKLDQLIVVSSDWHLKATVPFWREHTARSYLQLHLRPVGGTGGWRTRAFYTIFAAFIRTMLACRLWSAVEPFLYRLLYAPRYTKGFRTNGCA